MSSACCSIFEKFDSKNLLIKEYNHWILILRNKPMKLGNCVAITKKHHESLSQLTDEEMQEYAHVTRDAEATLKKVFNCELIHHLLLMLKDKHTHFHIIPRYQTPKLFAGREWQDDMQPILKASEKPLPEVPHEILLKIRDEIKRNL